MRAQLDSAGARKPAPLRQGDGLGLELTSQKQVSSLTQLQLQVSLVGIALSRADVDSACLCAFIKPHTAYKLAGRLGRRLPQWLGGSGLAFQLAAISRQVRALAEEFGQAGKRFERRR